MKYRIQPWKHQLEAIERAKTLPNFALFFEMGTGKTATTVNILRHKFAQNQRVMRTLILCPQVVITNWEREIGMHSNINEEQVIPLVGSGLKRIKSFKKEVEEGQPGKIYITNYEALTMDKLFQEFLSYEFEILVCDESHKVKNIQAKRTKKVIIIGDGCRHVYLLSGTPILNSPMDIFSQFRAMDGGKAFGKNFFAFRAEYFVDKNAGMPSQTHFPDWQIRPGSYERISEKMGSCSMVVKKEECLDLPPLMKEVVSIELSYKQRVAYSNMLRWLVAYIDDKACVAEIALTKALRLMQIASGFVKIDGNDGGEVVVFKPNPRAKALEELLEMLIPNHKVIVWAVFHQNYEEIRSILTDRFGVGFVEVHGSVSQKDKSDAIDRFNNDDDCRVYVGHPGSGGIGVNLTAASYSIFYSRNFSLEYDLQAEARNYRGGSEVHDKITRIDLVAEDTIDEDVARALADKVSVSEKVLGDIINGRRKECWGTYAGPDSGRVYDPNKK